MQNYSFSLLNMQICSCCRRRRGCVSSLLICGVDAAIGVVDFSNFRAFKGGPALQERH